MGDHDVRRKPRSAGRDQSELGLLAVDGARAVVVLDELDDLCLLYTSPSPRDATLSRMPSSA